MKISFGNLLLCIIFGCLPALAYTTSLPIQMINGLPYVEAKINGQGPYLFGFDSGFGGELELDSSLSVKLGLVTTGQLEMGDPSGKNSRMMNTTQVQELALGDIIFSSSNVILRNRRAMPGMEKVAGILGISLFRNYLLTIDLPNKEFIIEKGNLPKANGRNIFDYVSSGGGVPGILMRVGNIEITAFLDTRAMSSYFILPGLLVEKLQLATAPRQVGRASTVSNTIIISEVQLIDTIFLGDQIYPAPTISYPSLNNSAIIGSKALQEYRISFDQENKRVRLDRAQTLKEQPNKIVPASASVLQEYVGQYGDRTVGIDVNGSFFIQRPGGRELKMILKAPDEFSLEIVPEARIIFERDDKGKIIAIKVLNQQGNWERSERKNL